MKGKMSLKIICIIFMLLCLDSTSAFGQINDTAKKYTVITPCKYYSMEGYYNGLAAAADTSKSYGLVDTAGMTILPFEYESLNFEAAYYDKDGTINNLYCAKLKGKFGIIDSSGKQVIPFSYDSIDIDKWVYGYYGSDRRYNKEAAPRNSFNEIYFRVTINGMSGLIDGKGNFAIPAKYSWIYPGSYIGTDGKEYDFAIVSNRIGKNLKYSVLNKNGSKILPKSYDLIKDMGGGQICLGTGKVGGHINGEPFIYVGYGEIYDLAKKKVICKSGKNSVIDYNYGDIYYMPISLDHGCTKTVIDRTGKTIIPGGSYYYVLACDEGFIVGKQVKGKEYFGLMNKQGKLILPLAYQRFDQFKNGVAFAKKDNRYGIITKSYITPFIYTNGGVYDNGVYYLTVNNKTTIYNKNRTVIGATGKYKGIAGVFGELTFVKSGSKIGAIDTNGKIVIPAKYDSFVRTCVYYADSTKRLAVLTKDGVYVAVDSSGQVLLNNLNKEQSNYLGYKGNYIYTYDNNINLKLFDLKGKLLIDQKIYNFQIMDNGYIIISNESGCSLYDKNGSIIINSGEFDGISPGSDGFAIVNKDGLSGVIRLVVR